MQVLKRPSMRPVLICEHCGCHLPILNLPALEAHATVCDFDPDDPVECSLCRLKFSLAQLAAQKMSSRRRAPWGMVCSKCCEEIDIEKKAARLRKTIRRHDERAGATPKGE